MVRIIGLGEMAVSDDALDVIKTFALSSCVGVTVYSQCKRVAGMAHIVLPNHFDNINRSVKPVYYATTGVPLLIHQMLSRYGCPKQDLVIKIFGGANSKNSNDIFKVGYRNLTTIQQLLDSMNLRYQLADAGGTFSRTLEMNVYDGQVKVTKLPLNSIL